MKWVTLGLLGGFFASQLAVAAVELKPFLRGFNAPVHVAVAPGQPERVYVVEQGGKIVVVENGKKLAQPFLDIASKVTSGGETGLLSIAFHPKYESNGRYFINYTAKVSGQLTTIIAERDGTGAEKTVLSFAQPFSNHNGGMLLFGKDGLLYIGTGDGGAAGDPFGNGQKLTSYLGKMLRIDVDVAGKPYGIPKDNPFTEAEALPEIFAWGLRNPWRYSFDRETNALFAGDVGQDKREEIDIIEKAKNYGWNTMEASLCYKPANCNTKGLELPIYEYGREVGQSITGGYVYRGKEITELYGKYLYADYQSRKVWALNYDQAAKKVLGNEALFTNTQSISSFGEDMNGEIYAVSLEGTLYKLVKK